MFHCLLSLCILQVHFFCRELVKGLDYLNVTSETPMNPLTATYSLGFINLLLPLHGFQVLFAFVVWALPQFQLISGLLYVVFPANLFPKSHMHTWDPTLQYRRRYWHATNPPQLGSSSSKSPKLGFILRLIFCALYWKELRYSFLFENPWPVILGTSTLECILGFRPPVFNLWNFPWEEN